LRKNDIYGFVFYGIGTHERGSMAKHDKHRALLPKGAGQIRAGRSKKELLAEVIERRELNETLVVLTLRPTQAFPFQPGQYVKVGIDGVKRRYSIVSAPHEEILEFCIERVPGGEMTARVWTLQRGDIVAVRAKPKGKLWLDLRVPAHLMVATVTGIGPFVSMLRAYLHEGRQGHTFGILHGASYLDDFAYQAELEQLAARHPDLVRYVPVLSRPVEARNARWTGETGRVSGLVAKYMKRFAFAPRSTQLYACGHPGMVREVKEQFGHGGFRVQAERYWKA
jgi:NAD(P)H-flavin reductase